MAESYHVNGSAHITTDSSACGFSSADGVAIKINGHYQDIYSDERGPEMPAERVWLGTDATVTFELWKYDDTVAAAFIAKRNGGTFGAMGTIGDLMFANSRMSTLQVASPIDNHVWTFNRCAVEGEAEYKHSVGNITMISMTVKCVPDASGIICTRT